MKSVAMETADDNGSQASDEQLMSLQIYVPELLVQKCMQFNRDELIWDVKQQILASLPKELKEGFNYGLFCPPVNGKAGKFLDEERPLADYPFPDNTCYLELRYKRRIYKMMNVEEKQLKQLHTRANLRRLLEHVANGHVEKITKMCTRGLDPNFHCSETGETPLTLSVTLRHPAKIIIALVNGGAHLDFRTKEGYTALHRGIEKNNLESLKTLLDLGASPNYKDMRGLTPLYYTVLYNSDPQLTEVLLHDHATVGSADPHGWQEVHQACKYGLVQHLEHLLFYGADMNARNASGNTPLHVCAVNDQESCARVLLFRGADKGALNYANQNPHQVAVIAGNLRLAEIIKNHRPEDVVPYRDGPRYNPRRRTSCTNISTLSHNHSDPRLELALSGKPPSPCPSNHSLPPFSSGSEVSTGSSCTETQPSEGESEDTASGSVVTESSESSGVCTSNSGTSYDSYTDHQDPSKTTPVVDSVCVCVEDYMVNTPGHLQLTHGDLVEVTAIGSNGYLEGRRRDGEEGMFPGTCVHEVQLRGTETLPSGGKMRVEGRREMNAKKMNSIPRRWRMYGEPRTVILHKGKKGFGFVLRGAKGKATSPLMERQPTEFWPSLQYLDDVDKGGVAELAGLKKGDFLLEINGQDVSQASHEHVVAIIRQSGDLVAMTVVTVTQPPGTTPTEKAPLINRQCATLPRKLSGKKAPLPPKRDPRTTLSVGRARARSMVAGLAEIEVLDHTLNEYDSEGRSTKSSSIESIPNKQATTPAEGITANSTTPPTTTSTTTSTPTGTTNQKIASIRSRPSSRRISATEFEDFLSRQVNDPHINQCVQNHQHPTSIPGVHKVYGSVAAMKRSKALKCKGGEEEGRIHKDFHSTPDLNADVQCEVIFNGEHRRSRSQDDFIIVNGRRCRHSWACPPHTYSRHLGTSPKDRMQLADGWLSDDDLHKYKHSDKPEPIIVKDGSSGIYAETIPINQSEKTPPQPPRASCPPPSYPPPPPPVGQVVKVDVSRSLGEYANLTMGRQGKGNSVMSSFRPGDSAKLYASPDAIMGVGYKKEHLQKCDATLPRHLTRGSNLRSHSLPPKMPGNKIGVRSATSSDAENSGDSGVLYPGFRTTHRQRDSLSSDSGHVSDKGTLKPLKGKPPVTNAYGAKYHSGNSEPGSPKHFPTLSSGHEPFIPEPDYDSSEEEGTRSLSTEPGGKLVTFMATTPSAECQSSFNGPEKLIEMTRSPHTTAKRAIHEARERLNQSQKSADKSPTSNYPQLGIDAHSESSPVSSPGTPQDQEVTGRSSPNKSGIGSPLAHHHLNINGPETISSKEFNGTIKDEKIPVPPPLPTIKHLSPNTDKVHNKKLDENGTKESPKLSTKTKPIQKVSVLTNHPPSVHLNTTEDQRVSKDSSKDLSSKKSLDVQKILKQNNVLSELAGKFAVPPPPPPPPAPENSFIIRDGSQRERYEDYDIREASMPAKMAPAVPSKPKHDLLLTVEMRTEFMKAVDTGATPSEEIIREISPGIEIVSRSVRENIYNFEKRTEMAAKATTFSPRRKSDGIRIALMGSQSKSADKTDIRTELKTGSNTMKTSKSCPKTFNEDDDNDSSPSGVSSDTEPQNDHRIILPCVPSPVTPVAVSLGDSSVKRPPDTPPKVSIQRRIDSYNKQSTLGRRASIETEKVVEVPSMPTSVMTLNRQTSSTTRRNLYTTTTNHPQAVLVDTRKVDNIFTNAVKGKEIEVNDNQMRNSQQMPFARIVAEKPLQKNDFPNKLERSAPQDDECLRLCQRVDQSLQMIRLQVDSLGLAAVNEVDVLTELVPPPPEFAPPHSLAAKSAGPKGRPENAPSLVPLAPPPEFCDDSLGGMRMKAHHHPMPVCRLAVNDANIRPASPEVHIPNYNYRDYAYRTMVPNRTSGSPQHGMTNKSGTSPAKNQMIKSYEAAPTLHQMAHHQYNNYGTLPVSNRLPASLSNAKADMYSPMRASKDVPRISTPQKEFRQKPLHEWSGKDVSDWLESLFLPEYKICFAEAGITGAKLANMDNNDLMGLGVKQAGHRINMERSIKWYLK